MSSISSISSLLSSLLLYIQGSSSADDTRTMAETWESSITDSVSLSTQSLEMVKSLVASLGDGSTESDDSTDSICDILVSAQNQKLIQDNPDLVEIILSTDSSDATGIDAMDLFELGSQDLLSIIEKYSEISGSATTTSTWSQIDEIL
jgi:hypothetical protein